MTSALRPGDVLASRYRLLDLLVESGNGRFWRAHDVVLDRHVALHTIAAGDPRAEALLDAARRSTTVVDRRLLRVLDASVQDGVCYVVHEWGAGVSLDIIVGGRQALDPRQAGWVVGQVAQAVARAHERGVAHGLLAPENILLDRRGHVRVIGTCVDAALHGLPFDDPSTDVADLAGLLHCALTSTWAGTSRSDVRRAPSENGRVLRPRRVRAGIPKPLDALCESTLNPRSGAQPPSAADLAVGLRDFVGDDTGVPESVAAVLPPVHERFPMSLPPVPDLLPHDPVERPTAPEDEATQAALPTFEEDTRTAERVTGTASGAPDGAGTTSTDGGEAAQRGEAERGGAPARERRRTPGPPPPPPPDPPARPLFAPDPPAGSPTRRSRVTAANGGSAGDTGSLGASVPWSWGAEESHDGAGGLAPAPEEPVPGRRTLRLALVLGLLVAAVVAAVVLYDPGGGRMPLGAGTTPSGAASPTSSPGAGPTPVRGLSARDLDPQGEDGEENPDQAALAVDGDSTTAWSTVRYFQQLGPGGLKTGVGLSLDLGGEQDVSAVQIDFEGTPSDGAVFVADEEPSAVEGLTRLGRVRDAGQRAVLTPEEALSARYVVVWLTSLPTVTGGYAGGLREVVVLGE